MIFLFFFTFHIKKNSFQKYILRFFYYCCYSRIPDARHPSSQRCDPTGLFSRGPSKPATCTGRTATSSTSSPVTSTPTTVTTTTRRAHCLTPAAGPCGTVSEDDRNTADAIDGRCHKLVFPSFSF